MRSAGAGWALDLEVVTQEIMELLKRFDDQEIDREPDGPSPVRVAAEEPGLRLRRLIIDSVFIPIQSQRVRADPDGMRESERIPYGERNSDSSSMMLSTRRSRSRLTSDKNPPDVRRSVVSVSM